MIAYEAAEGVLLNVAGGAIKAGKLPKMIAALEKLPGVDPAKLDKLAKAAGDKALPLIDGLVKRDVDDVVEFVGPRGAAIARKLEAESFISRHAIDMTNAPASSARNALGFQRNGPWFWRQLRTQKPDMFSADNLRRIRNRQAPIVDEAWVRHNPQHADFLGDKLIHHHIDQGRFASGLPESIHQQLFDLLHNRTTR